MSLRDTACVTQHCFEMAETSKGRGLASQNKVPMNQEYKLCTLLLKTCAWAFLFSTCSSSFLYSQKEALEPYSSAHYTWNTPGQPSPLATLLGVSHFICQQNPSCPVTLISCRLLIIQIICHYQADAKLQTNVNKRLHKKSKTLQMDQQHMVVHLYATIYANAKLSDGVLLNIFNDF